MGTNDDGASVVRGSGLRSLTGGGARIVLAALLVVFVGWSAVGCTNRQGEDATSPSEAKATVIQADPTIKSSESELATARLAEVAASDREAAMVFIYRYGGCPEPNLERCIANVLMSIAPESPAIDRAIQSADAIERLAQEATAEEVRKTLEDSEEAAQAETDRQLAEYLAGIAAAEAEKAAKAAEQEAVSKFVNGLADAERAVTAAKQIGEDLVASECFGDGGEYTYWTDPPRAVVTSCDAPRRVSGGGDGGSRTGAVCNDGWLSAATGRGACSHHRGVAYWTY